MMIASAGHRFAVLLAVAAFAAGGRAASFAPVNAKAYRLRTPDGAERIFVRDAENPASLYGDGEWVAELEGRRALVMKDVESVKDREGYLFQNGFLLKQLVGEVERNVAPPPVGDDETTLAALWPEKGKRLVAADIPDIWSGGDRLRLWFGNPNKAGVLFAELALAALALVVLRAPCLRFLGVLLALASFAGMVLTSSRGAFLAFLCALAAVGLARFRSLLSWRKAAVGLGAVAVAAGCLFATGQMDRMAKNLFNEGQRETSRLTVWSQVPRMMADAPGGWGSGCSARAYIDWYQPESACLLKDLISGHLTFLVETGWPVRFAYVFLWLFAGLAAFAAVRGGASPATLAIVVAFGVAGAFNPVVAVWELWVVPAFAALALAFQVRRLKVRTVGFIALAAVLLAAGALAGVCAWGRKLPEGAVAVRKAGGAVWLNGKNPSTWLVDDDFAMHGGYWWLQGRAIRDAIAARPQAGAIGYARSLADVPAGVEKLVLLGEAGREWLESETRPAAKKVVLISPPFAWSKVPAELREECDVSVVAGELAVRGAMGAEPPPRSVRIVPGAELYIPGWTRYVL